MCFVFWATSGHAHVLLLDPVDVFIHLLFIRLFEQIIEILRVFECNSTLGICKLLRSGKNRLRTLLISLIEGPRGHTVVTALA